MIYKMLCRLLCRLLGGHDWKSSQGISPSTGESAPCSACACCGEIGHWFDLPEIGE